MPRIEKANRNKFSSFEANSNIERETLDSSSSTGAGIACSPKFEPIPEYISADCEKVVSQANSYIVLGRDRPSGRVSGYGGIGATGAHSIDLVVGRRAPGAPAGAKVFVDPNFTRDAARIYISEKTDIDRNFKISSKNSVNAVARSAIALKADGIRVIAEDSGIKLVTGISRINSNGKLVNRSFGVDLIGGNDDEGLQPMVKGRSLVKFLGRMVDQINDINGLVMEMASALSLYELGILTALGVPFPFSAGIATPVTVAKQIQDNSIVLRGAIQKISLASNTINYLTSIGKDDILSNYHRVN